MDGCLFSFSFLVYTVMSAGNSYLSCKCELKNRKDIFSELSFSSLLTWRGNTDIVFSRNPASTKCDCVYRARLAIVNLLHKTADCTTLPPLRTRTVALIKSDSLFICQFGKSSGGQNKGFCCCLGCQFPCTHACSLAAFSSRGVIEVCSLAVSCEINVRVNL